MTLNYATCSIFDPVNVVRYEGITQPCNTQDTNTGAHTGFEGARVQDGVSFNAADDRGQRRDAQHDDQDCVGGVHQRFSDQAKAWAVDDGVYNYANHAQQEQPNGGFRASFDFNLSFTAQFNQAFFQTLTINRVVRQFGVEQCGDQEGHHQNGQQGGRNDHGQQVNVADAMTFHDGRHVNHGCGDWRSRNRNLCRNHCGRERTARLDTLFLRNFSDNRQRCQRDVASTGKDSQEIGHDRCKDRDVFRVLTQQFFSLMNQIVQTTCNLHS